MEEWARGEEGWQIRREGRGGQLPSFYGVGDGRLGRRVEGFYCYQKSWDKAHFRTSPWPRRDLSNGANSNSELQCVLELDHLLTH